MQAQQYTHSLAVVWTPFLAANGWGTGPRSISIPYASSRVARALPIFLLLSAVAQARIVTFDPAIHNHDSTAEVGARYVMGLQGGGGSDPRNFESIVRLNTSTGEVKFDNFRAEAAVHFGGAIRTETCDAFGNCQNPITAWLSADITAPDVTGSTEWLTTSPPNAKISMPAAGFPAQITGTLTWSSSKDGELFGEGSTDVTYELAGNTFYSLTLGGFLDSAVSLYRANGSDTDVVYLAMDPPTIDVPNGAGGTAAFVPTELTFEMQRYRVINQNIPEPMTLVLAALAVGLLLSVKGRAK